MADEYVDARISDLTAADSISDDDLFVLEQSATAKKLPGLILKNMATNAGSAAGAAAGQAFVQAAEAAADDAQDAAGAAVRAARNAQDILDDVEVAGDLALADIEDAADDSLADIAAANTSALSNISSASSSAISNIAQAKTEAMADIEAAVDEVEDAVYDIDGLKDTLLVENSKSGTFITVEDAAPVTAKKLTLTLEPHQNLNGYASPWPAGGGKNKFQTTATTTTVAAVLFTVNSDGSVKPTRSGSSTANASLLLGTVTLPAGSYLVNGGNAVSDAYMTLRDGNTDAFIANITDSDYALTVTEEYSYKLVAVVASNVTPTGTLKPMIRLSSESDATFAPYSNICPIEGWTGVEVNRTGKNFIDEDTLYASFKTGTNAFSGTASAINLVQFNIPQELVGQELTFSAHISSFGANNVRVCAAVGGSEINGNFGSAPFWSSVTFTPTSTSDKVQITFGSSGSGITVFDSVQLETGSTRTTYEQYGGQDVVVNICINQWDEEWEICDWSSSDGSKITGVHFSSKNKIPVKPSTSYYFASPAGQRYRWLEYGADDSYKGYHDFNGGNFTVGSDTYYVTFMMATTYGQTYNHDISINYPSTFTDYFPYTGRDIAYSGYIDVGKGKMVLDMGIADLGNREWLYHASTGAADTNRFNSKSNSSLPDAKQVAQTGYIKLLSDAYMPCRAIENVNITGGSTRTGYISVYYTGQFNTIIITDTRYTDPAEFAEAVKGLKLLYELATPITIQLAPHQLDLLKGLNNIQTDADDMELAYCYVKDGKSVVVGNAEQLLSKEVTNDQEPYLFRASGGNGADREYDTLVGGTVAWNQLAINGDFSNGITGWNKNGTATWSLTNNVLTLTMAAHNVNNRVYQSNTFIEGHKYIAFADIWASEAIAAGIGIADGALSGNNLQITTSRARYAILMPASNSATAIAIGSKAYYASAINLYIANVEYTDLTAIFGSTIADYAYSLEQATAGSGVAWLKKYGFFTKPYYPYNPGELMSVKTTRHKMVGFNWFDEEWPTKTATYMRGTKIKVFPNTRYYGSYFGIKGTSIQVYWAEYNDSGSLISPNSVSALTSEGNAFISFVTKPNVAYIMPQINFSGTAPSGFKSCLGLYNTAKNGTYEPYTAYEYPLDPKLTLQGIYKLNGDKLYCDGDKYYPNKGVERYYKLVDLGTLTYTKTTSGLFSTSELVGTIKPPASGANPADNVISGQFVVISSNSITGPDGSTPSPDKVMAVNAGGTMFFNWLAVTTPADFKIAMSGQYLVYELATPYFETADPFEQLQALDPYGTEEYIDDREVPIPVGHDTNYPVNLRSEIERVMKEVPPPPTSNGTYILKVTVASGVPTYSWVAQ